MGFLQDPARSSRHPDGTDPLIIVCAQHVCAHDCSFAAQPTGEGASRKGFLKDVLDRAASGVPTRILSQTYPASQEARGCRRPKNKSAFRDFVEAAQHTPHCAYYVNPNLHAKFIVINDILVATTCNFTPSQFIYQSDVNIESFQKIPNTSYSGIFCEIGAYFVQKSKDLADLLTGQTDNIIALPRTRRML